jgi:hypothetical protein
MPPARAEIGFFAGTGAGEMHQQEPAPFLGALWICKVPWTVSARSPSITWEALMPYCISSAAGRDDGFRRFRFLQVFAGQDPDCDNDNSKYNVDFHDIVEKIPRQHDADGGMVK